MRFLLKWLSLLLALSIPALLAGFFAIQFDQGEVLGDRDQLDAYQLLAINTLKYCIMFFFAAIYVTIVVSVVFFFYKMLRNLTLRFLNSSYTDTGDGWKAGLSVGIAAIFFPAPIYVAFQSFSALLSQVFIESPTRVVRMFGDTSSCFEVNGNLTSCIPIVINTLGFSISEFFSSIIREIGIDQFNAREFVLFLVSATLIYTLLTRIGPALSASTRVWACYAVLSVFAIYLALSAVLAVPLMQTTREIDEISPQNLRATLEKFYVGDSVKDTSIAANDTSIASPEVSAAPPSPARSTEASSLVDNFFSEYMSSVIGSIKEYGDEVRSKESDLSSGFEAYRKGLIDNAVVVYETESAVRIGEREKSQHYLSIIDWYRGNLATRLEDIERCRQSEREIDVIEESIVQHMERLRHEGHEGPQAAESTFRNVSSQREAASSKMLECTSTGGRDQWLAPPSRGSYGTSLGFIGYATRWLLAAESIPVVLVVGLTGFGLLGALVSRFAREPNQANAEHSVRALTAVAFSGFVAALVVYLAAYGGIAVISTSKGDPNPYVVFAACLVGAIFAEDVWRWAKEAFLVGSPVEETDKPKPSQ